MTATSSLSPVADLFWIIGGGLLQVPLVEEVRKLGYSPLVSDRDASCACAPLADRLAAIDIFDIEGHQREADRLQTAGDRIAAHIESAWAERRRKGRTKRS